MNEAKPVTAPLAAHLKLSKTPCLELDEGKTKMDKYPYANVVGSIMYAYDMHKTISCLLFEFGE